MKKRYFKFFGIMTFALSLAVMMPMNVQAKSNNGIDVAFNSTVAEPDISAVSEQDGWVDNEDGTKSYYVDGEAVSDTVMEIDDNYYYFNPWGDMAENEMVYTYDENGNVYYYAGEGGILFVNSWHEDGASKYYFGEDRKAVSGLHVIDGKNYLFSEYFSLVENIWHDPYQDEEGNNYIFAEDSSLVLIPEDTWTTVDEYTYYVQDGELCYNQVYLIDGNYYAFDGYHRLYTTENEEVTYYDENDNPCRYRVGQNNALYQSTWYENEYEELYYYGSDALGYVGVKEVEEKLYYFNEYGVLQLAGTVCDEKGNWYAIKDDTTLELLADSGWTTVEGNQYYIADGEAYVNAVYLIDGNYYAFDSCGCLCAEENAVISYGDDSATPGIYRVGKDSILLKDTWYYEDEYRKYYYGSDCAAYTLFNDIDGKTYYFDSSDGCSKFWQGFMRNGKAYAADKDSVVTELSEGWNDVNGTWYYFDGTELYEDKIYLIGSYYYYFDSSSRMVSNKEESYWDRDAWETYFVRAKSNGVLCRNEWFEEESGSLYYYGDDCFGVEGIHTIDGKTYSFSSWGCLDEYTGFHTIDGVCYFFLEDYSLVELKEGWNTFDGTTYYVEDNELVEDCIKEIDGKTYIFEYGGTVVKDQWYSIYDYDLGTDVIYYAKEDGSLYQNEWFVENGCKYYFDENCHQIRYGIYTIDGKDYFFDENVLTNTFHVIDGVCYVIDKDGVVIKSITTGWYKDSDGYWIYIENGEIFQDGIKVIDGNTYLFAYGSMCESGIHCIDGKYYVIKSNDTLVTTKGWYKMDGSWFYVDEDYTLHEGLLTLGSKTYIMELDMVHSQNTYLYNGKMYAITSSGVATEITTDGKYYANEGIIYIVDGKIYEGWKYINKAWYYFEPEMVIGRKYYIYNEDKYYYFDQNGKMVSNKWIFNNQSYATSSGALAVGEKVIGGKTYFFDYEGILVEGFGNNNGEYAIYGADGTKTVVEFKEGWNKASGSWYYVLEGELVKDEEIMIGNKYYRFDYTGKMITNVFYENRYYGASGAAHVGWLEVGGNKYYFDEYANICYGQRTINDKEYFFDYHSGCMYIGEKQIQDYIYKFNEDGTIASITEFKENGWNYVDSRAYYFKDGYYYTGWLGNSYISYGEKIIDDVIEDASGNYYYIDENGNYVKNKWVKYNGINWVYAKANGVLARDQWLKWGNYWYYFDEYANAVTGIKIINGVTYYFDEDGIMLKEYKTVKNGWHQIDGKWLYAVDGSFLYEGNYYINGAWYQFHNYAMESKHYCFEAYGYYHGYYYTSSGTRYNKTGWCNDNGKWLYITADYTAFEGWLTLGSNTYYFSPYMTTGYKAIEGKLYYFDANGVCQGTRGVKNGWYKAGGKWYYFVDGKLTTGGTTDIKGTLYYFDGYEMLVNGIVHDYDVDKVMFFGADGKLVTTEGIYTDSHGEKVYVDVYGEAHIGIVYIDGEIKFMDGHSIDYYWFGYNS